MGQGTVRQIGPLVGERKGARSEKSGPAWISHAKRGAPVAPSRLTADQKSGGDVAADDVDILHKSPFDQEVLDLCGMLIAAE